MRRDKIDFMDPNGNEKFSRLRGLDLQDLLFCIEEYYLVYRESLGLPKDVSFGAEIEYEHKTSSENIPTASFLWDACRRWELAYDGSLNSGGEIRSPILHDVPKDWKDMKKICEYLTAHEVNTCKNAGGHIHVGAHILGESIPNWISFLKVYCAYENVLFRFFFGDKLSGREKMFYYAEPIARKQYRKIRYYKSSDYTDIREFLANHLLYDERYHAINFYNVDKSDILDTEGKNTVEFRLPNGSSDHVIWQNNINTCIKMMLAGKKGLLDEDFLDYKLENEAYYENNSGLDNRTYFTEIDLVGALEFVDLVFDKNIDKVYFLRQYLRNLQTVTDKNVAVLAKRFTA